MAGITEDMKKEHFYKGEFIDKNPIELLQQNDRSFDYIDNKSSTYKYIQEIKKLSQK